MEANPFVAPGPSPSRVDLLVVGGGVAGLTAAAFAARAGLRVELVDKSELGGRARTRRVDGFSLNLGAHALYRNGPAARVLEALRVPTPGARVPALGQALVEGVLHALPVGPLSMLTTGVLDASGKLELARLMVWLRGADLRPVAGRTVAEVLDARVQHPGVRAFALGLMRVATYDPSPEHLCAAVGLGQMRRATFDGVTYVDGGWATLVEGLADVGRTLGVRLHERARVGEVVAVRDGFRVAIGDEERVARTVLVAAPPRVAKELFPSLALPHAEEVRAACLDVALGAVPCPRNRFVMGLDAPVYYSLHSAVARLAPEGGGVAHLLRYGDPVEGGEAELRALLERMQPGAPIVEARYLPRMTVSHHRPTATSGGLAGRAAVVTSLPGVFLAGDWVGDDALLADAAFASAALAAESAALFVRARRAA
ncbi:MAG: FAD-dependent oxidoreductase [Myxococcales bacterium]|nr:FAD-dependent oxidoreductase [Myxococcales bacterium]